MSTASILLSYPLGVHILVRRLSSVRPGKLAPDWWGSGVLTSSIKRGVCLSMIRTENQKGKSLGLFRTSEIRAVSSSDDGSLGVKTRNSVYRVSLVVDTP